jgi:hypothetical protein
MREPAASIGLSRSNFPNIFPARNSRRAEKSGLPAQGSLLARAALNVSGAGNSPPSPQIWIPENLTWRCQNQMRISTTDYPDFVDVFFGGPNLKVAQDFILQTDRNCRSTQVSSDPVQVKTLRYSETCATPSGLPSAFEARETTRQVLKKSRGARSKPIWMQFKKDEANLPA